MSTPDTPEDKEVRTSDAKAILAAYKMIKRPGLDLSRWRAKNHLITLLKTHSVEDILRAVLHYAMATEDTEEQFRRSAGNFFGRYKEWECYAARDWKPELDEQAEQDKKDQEAYDRIARESSDAV